MTKMAMTNTLATFNINGLGDKDKRQETFHYLHRKHYSIIFLQETHSMKNSEKLWNSTWGKKIWFVHGTSGARGVAILFAPEIDITVHNVIACPKGRFLIMYVTYNAMKILLVNVYAPNRDDTLFLQSLFRQVDSFSPDYKLIAGDFNVTLNSSLDRQGTYCNNDKCADWLNVCLNTQEMLDTWRYWHKTTPGFTWRKGLKYKKQVLCSRLDYIFVSETFEQFMNVAKIDIGYRSDHLVVVLEFMFEQESRGPGYWKLSTNLLRDADYVTKMNELLDRELTESTTSYRNTWEIAKLMARGSTIQYSARKQKSKRNITEALESKIKRLNNELINGSLFDDTYEQLHLVKHELRELEKEKTKGACIRVQANWTLHREMPTKYFLNLEKSKAKKKTLHRVLNEKNQLVYGKDAVLREITDF